MVNIQRTEDGYFVEHSEILPTKNIAALKAMHLCETRSILPGIKTWTASDNDGAVVTCVDGIGPLSVTTTLHIVPLKNTDTIAFRTVGTGLVNMEGIWDFSSMANGSTCVKVQQTVTTNGVTRFLPLRRVLCSRITSAFEKMRKNILVK